MVRAMGAGGNSVRNAFRRCAAGRGSNPGYLQCIDDLVGSNLMGTGERRWNR